MLIFYLYRGDLWLPRRICVLIPCAAEFTESNNYAVRRGNEDADNDMPSLALLVVMVAGNKRLITLEPRNRGTSPM